jgi:hypothetical protein
MVQNNRHIDFTDVNPGKTGHHDREAEMPDFQHESAESGKGSQETTRKKNTSPDTEKLNRKVRIKELIDGTFLVRENVIKQLPFVLFLTFIGVIYIGNRFHAEHMVRQINELKIEVGNLRAEQITITSELMNISRPSEVAVLVESKGLGLKESMEPPKKLKR